MDFKKPNINSQRFIFLSGILAILVISLILVPVKNWKKILGLNFGSTATSFTSSTGGNWNTAQTWGNTDVLNYPTDVFIDPSTSKIYVTDEGHNRIVVLNSDGSFFASYDNSDATSSPGLNLPDGVAVSPITGDIYISDTQNNRIVVLNSNGTASTTYDNLDSIPTPGLNVPMGIRIASTTGEIYIADNGNSRMVVLNANGTASTSYSLSFSPLYFDFSSSGEIYVSGDNNNITVLSSNGSASTTFNSFLSGTYGIAISKITGNIYVDDDGNEINIINPSFTLLSNHVLPTSFSLGFTLNTNDEVYLAKGNEDEILVLNSNGSASTTYTGAIEGSDIPGSSDDVVINTGPITLTQDQSVNTFELASGGSLDLAGHTLNIFGNWINSGGDLINNNGTVNFKGTSQTISGNNTFANFIKVSTSSAALYFEHGSTTTITDTLILGGASGNLLSIVPTQTNELVFESQIGSSTIQNGFNLFQGIHVGPDGKIYVADSGNSRIAVLNQNGTLYKIFNNSDAPYSPTGLIPNKLDLYRGNIYVSDSGNHRIVIINPDTGTSTVFASNLPNYPQGIAVSSTTGKVYLGIELGQSGHGEVIAFSADGSASTTYATGLDHVFGIKVDSNDNIYTSNVSGHNIVLLSATGTIIDTYDNSDAAYSPSGLSSPYDVDVAPNGDIYIADTNYSRVVVLKSDGTASTTYQDIGLSNIQGISLAPNGDIYIADTSNGQIAVLNSDGTPKINYGGFAGDFLGPVGVAHNSSNDIYVSDCYSLHSTVQKFDSTGAFIKFLDIPADSNSCFGQITVDSSDNLYVTDQGDNALYIYNSSDILATSSTIFASPDAIAVDSSGNIYINDAFDTIHKFDSGLNFLDSTSTADGMTFSLCYGGFTMDPDDNHLWVSDECNGRIVELNTSDLSFATSTYGPIESPFNNPVSVAFDQSGDILVSDEYGGIIKTDSNFNFLSFLQSGSDYGQFNSPEQITIDGLL